MLPLSLDPYETKVSQLLEGKEVQKEDGKDGESIKVRHPIIVEAEAGDLILWDSRTLHCNTAADDIKYYFAEQEAKERAEEAKERADEAKERADEAKEEEGREGRVEDTAATEAKAEDSKSYLSFGKGRENKDVSTTTEVAMNPSITIPPPNKLLRAAIYVCMVPRFFADEYCQSKRRDAFLKGKTSTHWPYGSGFFLPNGRGEDGEINKDWVEYQKEVESSGGLEDETFSGEKMNIIGARDSSYNNALLRQTSRGRTKVTLPDGGRVGEGVKNKRRVEPKGSSDDDEYEREDAPRTNDEILFRKLFEEYRERDPVTTNPVMWKVITRFWDKVGVEVRDLV